MYCEQFVRSWKRRMTHANCEAIASCYDAAGFTGLLFLMVAMVGVVAVGFGTVIATIRREERASKARSI
jgi:hypothetical protein